MIITFNSRKIYLHLKFQKFAVKIPEVTKTVRKMVKKTNEVFDILQLSSCNPIGKLNKAFSKDRGQHFEAKLTYINPFFMG